LNRYGYSKTFTIISNYLIKESTMKKSTMPTGNAKSPKFHVSRETVRVLTKNELPLVAAGYCVSGSGDTEWTSQASC